MGSWHKICPAGCFGAQMPVSHRWRHCNTFWGIGFTHCCSLIDINTARFFSTEDKLFSCYNIHGALSPSFPVGVQKIVIMSTEFQWTSERTFFWLRCWERSVFKKIHLLHRCRAQGLDEPMPQQATSLFLSKHMCSSIASWFCWFWKT